MAKFRKAINDLATTYPEIAKQWHPVKNGNLKPMDVTAGSGKEIWWQCKLGHEWQAAIYSRAKGDCGCPYCAGQKTMKGFNDLVTTRPQMAAQWHPTKNGILTPFDITAGSTKIIWWQCKHGHEWQNSPNSREKDDGCPYCCGRYPIKGETDLQTIHPDIAKEWDYVRNRGLTDKTGRDISTPDKISSSSNQKVWWRCEKGHAWPSTPSQRTRIGQKCGCPVCSNHKIEVGFNDLATTHPELVKEWHPTKNKNLNPTNIVAGSVQKAWWKCKNCGYEWNSQIRHRAKGVGCPVCVGRAVVAGKNDLQTLFPDIAVQWNFAKNGELKPTDVTAGSGKKVWWLCPDCGNEWQMPVDSRVRGCRCPKCAESEGEKTIRKILEHNNIIFKTEHKFEDRFYTSRRHPLKDDFAIFDKSGQVIGTIEYHGAQHYQPVDFAGKGGKWAKEQFELTQKRDKVKSDYLKSHNIPQLIIPYWEFDDIDKIVNDFIKELSQKCKLF